VIGLKITYEPFKEIVIKDCMKFEKLEDLIYAFAQLRAMGQPASLNWAEGVVFIHVAMQPITEELVEDFLKGRLYYVGVQFALMNKYRPVLTHKSPQGEFSLPVINVSSSRLLSELAKWLKTYSE
jgi:hypothetical protein